MDYGLNEQQTVYVMVGIPASGKSSYAKVAGELNKEATILSSDYIRYNVAEDKDDSAEVFRIMNKTLQTCLKNEDYNESIYYDATNTNRRRRRALYRNIKQWNEDAKVIIIFFSIPYQVAVDRNKDREGRDKVPEHVIERMHRHLQIPRDGVDCDNFFVEGIPIFKEDTSTPTESVEELIKQVSEPWRNEIHSKDMPHECPPWHLETIHEHINLCLENSGPDDMKEISLFHDLGKKFTKRVHEDGYATYRGHSDVSAHYYLNYLYFTLKRYDFYELDMLEAIYNHMNIVKETGKLGEKNIRNNKLEDVKDLVYRFKEIDNKSRVTEELKTNID